MGWGADTPGTGTRFSARMRCGEHTRACIKQAAKDLGVDRGLLGDEGRPSGAGAGAGASGGTPRTPDGGRCVVLRPLHCAWWLCSLFPDRCDSCVRADSLL